jgi:hypothetical protein
MTSPENNHCGTCGASPAYSWGMSATTARWYCKEHVRNAFGESEKATASSIAAAMIGGFAWDLTEEGRDYWATVHAKLTRIAKEGW